MRQIDSSVLEAEDAVAPRVGASARRFELPLGLVEVESDARLAPRRGDGGQGEVRMAFPRQLRRASEYPERRVVSSPHRVKLLSEMPGFVLARSPYCTCCDIQ